MPDSRDTICVAERGGAQSATKRRCSTLFYTGCQVPSVARILCVLYTMANNGIINYQVVASAGVKGDRALTGPLGHARAWYGDSDIVNCAVHPHPLAGGGSIFGLADVFVGACLRQRDNVCV